ATPSAPPGTGFPHAPCLTALSVAGGGFPPRGYRPLPDRRPALTDTSSGRFRSVRRRNTGRNLPLDGRRAGPGRPRGPASPTPVRPRVPSALVLALVDGVEGGVALLAVLDGAG